MPFHHRERPAMAVLHLMIVGCILVSLYVANKQGRTPSDVSPQLSGRTRSLLSLASEPSASLSVPSSSFDKFRRGMRKSVAPAEVPKIVHFTLADNPPPHHMKVVEYSRKLSESYGFKVMVHHDKDIAELIYSEYPTLIEKWEILQTNGNEDKGARVADFARMIILHYYGGVYLDGDMIPCHDLNELVEVPGVATFPLVNAPVGQISNSIISGPARHPVFWIALDQMRGNDDINGGSILGKTGAIMLAMSVDAYWKLTNTKPIVIVRDKGWLPAPQEGSKWLQSGLIRFGASMRKDYEHSRGMGTLGEIGMIHLHWRTWVSRGTGVSSKYSQCDKDLSLIKPFLDYSCEHVKQRDHAKWSDCGDGKPHSGMLGMLQ